MKKLLFFLMVLLLAACTNNMLDNNNNDVEDEATGGNNIFLSCNQLLDVTGLELYPFVSFTDEEWKSMSYDYKLDMRQIPEDFLHRMSTKELFYQIVNTDLSRNMLLYNMPEPYRRLNTVPELLNRPDAGHVLLETLQKVDPSKMDGSECFWFDFCLRIFLAQPEVINGMTDMDVDDYIKHQLRCHDVIQKLSKAKNPNWEYPSSVRMILLGLGNVMIRYDFEPFIKTLDRNPVTNELIWHPQFVTEQRALQVIDYVNQFKTWKK